MGIAELFEKHPCKADIISPNAAAELLGVDLMELESLTTERCPERNLPVIILWGRKFYRRSDVTWWKAEQLAAHPGAAERKEIADLFSRADHAEHNPGYQDYPLACALRAEARGRLHTWSKRYPAEWTQERAAGGCTVRCLCADNEGNPDTLHLHAKCHLTAPLSASLEGDVLTLRCYVPDCGRTVAKLRVAEIITDSSSGGCGPATTPAAR